MSLFDKFENKYIITGKLAAESPLHIGTGSLDFSPTAVDTPVIRDENNNPFIPGSSMKGVLRCFLERVVPSIYGEKEVYEEDDIWGCNILDNPCVTRDDVKEINNKFNTNKDRAKEIYRKECTICKLFGGQAFGSKIQISDAKLIGDKAHTQIRDGVAIDRDTLTGSNGKKYNFESVAAGTTFKFEMVIDNLEEEHKDLVKILLNYLENGDMKVGGKTSAGLGNVKLIDKKVYKIDKSNMKEYYINGLNKNEDMFKGDL